MKLGDIRAILEERGIQLTKSLGQNFLHDGNQLRRIGEAAELNRADKVLEIGPGLGPLTELLLEKAGTVLAIEKDGRLVSVLRERFASSIANGSLTLLEADALKFVKNERRDWSGWKLVSNLPYSVASPILVEFAQGERGPDTMVATLQLEVAKRIMSQAGEEDYGVLTLLLGLEYEPQGWFKIPAGSFFPAPDVDSACVRLTRRPTSLLSPAEKPLFTTLVKLAFSQRRKMMFKLLRGQAPTDHLEAAYRAVGLSPSVRAEAVGLEQFVQLTRSLRER